MESKQDFNIYQHESKNLFIIRIFDHETGEIWKKEIRYEYMDSILTQAVNELARLGYVYKKKNLIRRFVDFIKNLHFKICI